MMGSNLFSHVFGRSSISYGFAVYGFSIAKFLFMVNNPGVFRGVCESLISKSMMGLCVSDCKGG